MNCGKVKPEGERHEPKSFNEGVDFYFDESLMVLTRRFLLDRGYCCDNGCRHCPYGDSDGLE